MPDINLLKDTEQPDEQGRRKKSSYRVEMTRPTAERRKEDKLSEPRRSFFRELFSRKPKALEEEGKKEKQPDFRPSDKPMKTEKEEKVEDIFADITKPKEQEIIESEEETARPAPVAPLAKKEAKEPLSIRRETDVKKKEKKEKKEKKPEIKQEKSFLVNLLPEELAGQEEPRKKLINLGLIILGSVLVIVIAYFAMLYYQSSIVIKTEDVRRERVAVEGEIDSLKEQQEKTVVFKEKIDNTKNILAKHIYWTKFFEKLEEYTVKGVYYKGSLNVTTAGVIMLGAIAPDYKTVAEQLIVFRNAADFVQQVSITTASLTELTLSEGVAPGSSLMEQVSFAVALTLVPDIFYKSEEEIKTGEEGAGISDNNNNQNTNSSSAGNSNVNINFNFNINDNINAGVLP